jgi:Tfp pilus assembly protein PilF
MSPLRSARIAVTSAMLLLLPPIGNSAESSVKDNGAGNPAPPCTSEWQYLPGLEAAGDYTAVYRQAAAVRSCLAKQTTERKSGDAAAQDARLTHLNNLALLEQAEQLAARQYFDVAVDRLNALLDKSRPIDVITDSVLLSRAETLRQEYRPRTSDALMWESRIGEARALIDRGLAKKAVELFSDGFAKPGDAPTAALRAEANKAMLDARRAAQEGEVWWAIPRGVLIALRTAMDPVAVGLVVLLILLLLALLTRYLFVPAARVVAGGRKRAVELWVELWSELKKRGDRWPRLQACYLRRYPPKHIPIEIADLSRSDASTSDAGTLGRRLVQAVATISAGHFRGSNESDFLLVAGQSGDKTQAGSSVSSIPPISSEQTSPLSATDVKIGFLTVRLDPLLNWLRRFYARTRFPVRFEGTLRTVAEGESSGYEILVHKVGPGRTAPFHAYAPRGRPAMADKTILTAEQTAALDRAALDSAIEDIAAAIAIDLAGDRAVTRSAPSLRHYLRGMDRLERQLESGSRDRGEMGKASQSFWTALGHDPDNWLARYYLAYALRHCGQDLDAAGQFDQLGRMCEMHDDASVGLSHLKRHSDDAKKQGRPSVRDLVQWQACYARACSNDRVQLEKALATAEKANPTSGSELDWCYKLARLTARAHLLELTPVSEKDNRITAWGQVADAWDPFSPLVAGTAQIPKEIAADAQTVYGRAQYVNSANDAEDAILRLWHAVNQQPGFRDPDPYVTLAQIYIERQMRVWHSWAEKAMGCLEQALSIEPEHKRAHFWRAKLCEELGEFSMSLDELDQAGNTADVLELRAKILLDHFAPEPSKDAATEKAASTNPTRPREPPETGAAMLARAAKLASDADRAKELVSRSLAEFDRLVNDLRAAPKPWRPEDRERAIRLVQAVRSVPTGDVRTALDAKSWRKKLRMALKSDSATTDTE